MSQNARQLPLRSTDGGALDLQTRYDANGNVIEILDLARGETYGRWMAYDDLDRLTAAGSCSFGGDCWHRFKYDALDNIKSWSLGGVKDHRYYYDPNNRLTNIQNASGASVIGLGYDVQGNLENKNGQVYAFDYGNRLRRVTGKEIYRYDALGRRVLSVRDDWSTTNRLSMYNKAGQMIYTEAGNPRKSLEHYYLGSSLLAIRENDWAAGTPAIVRYQHTDALGSPAAVTDAAGAVIERTDWEPYGAAIGKPNYDGVGYTGHVMDGGSGLTYMQQRYYDEAIGRFLSVDPVAADVSAGGNFNRYWYANNNPFGFTDPDGRMGQALAVPIVVTGGLLCAKSSACRTAVKAAIAAYIGSRMLSQPPDVPVQYNQPEGGEESGGAIGPHAPGDVPDGGVIVRGGQGDMPEPGTKFSGSQGGTIEEAAAGVPHGTIRPTTAGEVRANGGTVEVAPEPTRSGTVNGSHVNITEGGARQFIRTSTAKPCAEGGKDQVNIPRGILLKVVAYREFYDVPRLILASEQGAGFWIFDSPFDDEADEYSQTYSVFFVGHDLLESKRLLESWSNHPRGPAVGSIELDRVRFDSTRRAEFICT